MADYEGSLRFRSDSREVERSTRDLRDLERQSERSERAARAFGRGIRRAFAGLSIGLIARQAIRNTIEQEQATSKLNAVLRSTGRFTEETSQALHDYASALQATTTFGDELILNAQAQLLTFKELGSEIFPRALKSALDLSTVMDQDLKSSVVQLGKALNDPITGITALQRVGVSFTESQKDTIQELARTNQMIEAQRLILDELESQFGGASEAARDTFGGALKGLQNAIGDLLEGDTSTGGLKGATDAFNSLTDALNDPEVQAGFDKVASGIGRVLEAAARAPQMLGLLGDAIRVNVTGTADPTDLDQINLAIEKVINNIEFLQSAIDTGAAGQMGGIFSASIRRQEAQLAQLQALQASLREEARRETPNVATNIPGLDADPLQPVVVTAEKREKELAAIQRRIARDMKELGENAAEGLRQSLNQLAAQQGGPSVEAAMRLADTMEMLQQQEEALRVSGQLTIEREQQIASARALATSQYEERIQAIRDEEAALAAILTPTEQLIDDLEFETSLIRLGNVERQQEIALRYAGAEATEAQRQHIRNLVAELEDEAEATRRMDAVRAASADSLTSLLDGTQSAGDALEDYFQRLRTIAARILAEKLIEKILGQYGTSGQSGGTGWGAFITAIGSAFGGGRAQGGSVMPGKFYEVAERGPELLDTGGRQFLIPNQPGQVTPISKTTTNNRSTVNVYLPPEATRRSAASLASAMFRESNRFNNRNR